MQHSDDAGEDPAEANSQLATGHDNPSSKTLLPLTIGAIGVVYGDIGTSPLYAFREALGHAASDGLARAEIIGVLSLMLWALIIIVTLKYIILLMRADNDGEGGILALLALALRGNAAKSSGIIAIGAIGAALFYGDAIITPALSVLAAVEGLKTLPGIGDSIGQSGIIAISLAILIALFAIQWRGTAAMSKLFGPICLVWFIALAAVGLYRLADNPSILAAFLPWHAVGFVAEHGMLGLIVLGAVFLTVTGAEALIADMGHFGKGPIRLGWLALVFPALALNYLGQGAFALNALEAAQGNGTGFVNQDWFFMMVPESVRLAMVLLATLATIIASQAVITGAYSLTQQAIQLGMLPRLRIRQTSAGHAGQIYMPAVNWLLLAGVIWLVIGFGSSSAMASAYGIAVTGTMMATCLLAYAVMRRRWHWGAPVSLAIVVPLLAIDSLFFGANILRIADGGWAPLTIGFMVLAVIWTWRRGRHFIASLESVNSVALKDMASALAKRPPTRVEGTAIYLTANNTLTPHALLHNIKHNHVLHRHNFVTTVSSLKQPHCHPDERISVARIDENFSRVELRYGFMEKPDVRADLIRASDLIPGAAMASFFIGRSTFALSAEEGLPIWQDVLFLVLHRNSADPTDYFSIPSNRVIELGAQYVI